MKSIIQTGMEYNELKDYTNVSITISKNTGVVDNITYQFNPDMVLTKVGKVEQHDYPVPAQFRHYEDRYPSPDIWLQYGEELKIHVK